MVGGEGTARLLAEGSSCESVCNSGGIEARGGDDENLGTGGRGGGLGTV